MPWIVAAAVAVLLGVPLAVVQRRQRRSMASHLPGQRSEHIPQGDPKAQAEWIDMMRSGGGGGGG